eukprot:CAMPEP_0115179056 /NCGR_PEP_ID=MMETSP0270-20121206/6217_1 /TAXON_ID=71861 /ORGANISM="Scrippsiella trochoidea, Strain CCMP3099" /LENGTH=195 /DNA_ID=CAMNT_0002592033 /DNA_START=84 /DNA_END=668 /DNA_ORIENTATION=-
MALAAQDAELAVQQKLQQKEQLAQSLRDFFEAADTSGDGLLTKEEFDDIIGNQKIKTWLSMLELSLHETEELFAILADGDGLVSFDEFAKGVVQLKGAARSEDVMAIKRNAKSLSQEVHRLHQALSQLTKLVQQQTVDLPRNNFSQEMSSLHQAIDKLTKLVQQQNRDLPRNNFSQEMSSLHQAIDKLTKLVQQQ